MNHTEMMIMLINKLLRSADFFDFFFKGRAEAVWQVLRCRGS